MARLTTAKIDLGVLGARQQQRSAIVSLLERLMIEAATLDYDVSNDDVFRALYAVACSEHSADYVPMRVLGNTAEAMVPKKRPRNKAAPKLHWFPLLTEFALTAPPRVALRCNTS